MAAPVRMGQFGSMLGLHPGRSRSGEQRLYIVHVCVNDEQELSKRFVVSIFARITYLSNFSPCSYVMMRSTTSTPW